MELFGRNSNYIIANSMKAGEVEGQKGSQLREPDTFDQLKSWLE
jgi:hypothetical protein